MPLRWAVFGGEQVPGRQQELAPTGGGGHLHNGKNPMGKDDTIKITEEEALELLRKRLLHLRETTDFFDNLFKTMGGYALIASDFDGNILTYNEEVVKCYEYTHKEIVGEKMNIEVFYPTDFIKTGKLSGIIKDTLIHGTCSFESEQTGKDGSRFPAHIALVVVKSNEGRIVGFVKIFSKGNDNTFSKKSVKNVKLTLHFAIFILYFRLALVRGGQGE